MTLPKEVSDLASAKFIVDSFPNLVDLVMKAPIRSNQQSRDMFTLANMLISRGVASSISARIVNMFSSPGTSLTADFFERGLKGGFLEPIFIHQSLHQDLPNILNLATNAGVHVVHVDKFTAYSEVEENLKKLEIFCVVKEAGWDKEVLEEEVEAANQLLDLLDNSKTRRKLRRVILDKVGFTCFTN